MKFTPLLIGSVAFLSSAPVACSRPASGATYEIRTDRESADQGSDGSSSSTTDRDVLIERTVAVRSDGVELEYDLPKDSEDRASNWQFPVKVFKPTRGSMQLLNRAELEARLDRWLKDASLSRSACGHWIFTWNAFRIECDPLSAIAALEAIDLRSVDVREGANYQDPDGQGAAPLQRTETGQGATFVAKLLINPDRIRRARAESDVVAAEIVKHTTLPIDQALRDRAKEAVSGTISVAFDVDSAGIVWRRTRVIDQKVTNAGRPSGISKSH